MAFLSFSSSRNGLSVRHHAVLVRLDVFFIGGLAIGSFRISSTLDMVAAVDDVSMLEVLRCSEELESGVFGRNIENLGGLKLVIRNPSWI